MQNVLGKTAEEHFYVTYLTPEGRLLVLEWDILGDWLVENGKRIAPQIHLECPRCLDPTLEQRKPLSISHPNKTVEIFEVPPDQIEYLIIRGSLQPVVVKQRPDRSLLPEGARVCPQRWRVTVQETITCPECLATYTLRDNVLERARR